MKSTSKSVARLGMTVDTNILGSRFPSTFSKYSLFSQSTHFFFPQIEIERLTSPAFHWHLIRSCAVLNSAQECHQMEDLDRKSSHPSKSSHFNHNILTDPTSTFTDEKTYNKIYNLKLLQKIGPIK